MQIPSIAEMHTRARQEFLRNPSKCYQGHLRELWRLAEGRETIQSLEGARVEKISRQQAASVILKYEWLAGDPLNKSPMGFGIKAYYGLLLNGELLGAACLGTAGGLVGDICGHEYRSRTVSLVRGACVPHAPANAASFFDSRVCKQAYKDHQWQIFFAYSDSEAGEIGTIYQAMNWFYLGIRQNSGRHYDYLSPDGKRLIKSHALNHDKKRKIMRSLGWTPELGIPMRRWLRDKNWTQIVHEPKSTWVWFEGSRDEKKKLMDLAKNQRGYLFLPYPPKRETHAI